jgi:protein-S-isoprenylcysteine O-methyltransferase Ste14
MKNGNFYFNILPYIFVSFQLGSLAYIAVTGPLIAKTWHGVTIEVIGLALVVWAVKAMKRNGNVTPVPKKNSRLVTTGPYKYIRHPMYIAQIIAVIPLIYENYTSNRGLALLTLITTLLFKLHYEEQRLILHYGDEYKIYQKKSKKLLPFIF